MKSERRTINVFTQQFEQFVADCSANGDAKRSAMFAAYQRAWQMLDADKQFQALRGGAAESDQLPADRRGNIQRACHAVQRGAVDLDAIIDESMRDGKFSRAERARVRRQVKSVIEKAC